MDTATTGKRHNNIICFFGRTLDLTIHYSLKMLILMIHAFAPAICVIIPRNHGRVETLPQLPHRVFAERHVLSWYCARHAARAAHKTIAHTKTISGGYLSRQRGDGGWNTKITFEHRHFAVEMWKSKCLSDSVTTSPLNWEVDSELFGSVGGETFLEYQARNFFWTGLFWEVAINYWHGYRDQIVVKTRPRSWMSTPLSTVLPT